MPTSSSSYRLWMGAVEKHVSFVHIGNGFVKEIQPKDTPSSKVGLNFLRVLVKLATNLQISLCKKIKRKKLLTQVNLIL